VNNYLRQLVACFFLLVSSQSFAQWGAGNWGSMVWGQTLVDVPMMGGIAQTVAFFLLLGVGMTIAKRWKFVRSVPVVIVGAGIISFLLALPTMVTAGPVGSLNHFVNSAIADADEVNANFNEVKVAVDDNYDRTLTAQQTADAAANGHTIDTNTQLTETQVDDFVDNNGYALAADVQNNAESIAVNAEGIATNATNIASNTSDTSVLQSTLAAIQAFLCSDGVILEALEACDDGNRIDGDGCSSSCAIEPSFVCSGLPSVCSAPEDVRFVACADGVSVEDKATGLVWERKTELDGVHNVNNSYSWSADITSIEPDGTVYTVFLNQLNSAGFGGHGDWRLPIVSEMQSILVGEGVLAQLTEDPASGQNLTQQSTVCYSPPCLDPDFLAHAGYASPSYPVVVNGLTDQVTSQYRIGVLPYWSSQTFLPEVSNAYGVNFGANARIPSNIQTPQILEELPAGIQAISKESGAPQPPSNRKEVAVFARAVREGSCDL
jgi:cysteine-rich repeat protein